MLECWPLLSDAHNPTSLTVNFELPGIIEKGFNDGLYLKLWDE